MGAPINSGLGHHLTELLVISSVVVTLLATTVDFGLSSIQKWADAKYTV